MSRYNRCKECYNMKCIFVTGEREDFDTSECKDFRPMNNADRVRGMTDEELAMFIANQRGWYCDFKDPSEEEYPKVMSWLKTTVEVDDGKTS